MFRVLLCVLATFCFVACGSECRPSDAASCHSFLPVRNIKKVFTATTQKEGAGFVINRPFPGQEVTDKQTDPFLMLDELGPIEYGPGDFEGAPWHPHRGFITVTYMKAGEGKHQDSMGNSGILRAGEVQWMKAASGIIHDEGRDHPGGLLHGFQMWVNLPSKHKMDPPSYQQLLKDHFRWQTLPSEHVVEGSVEVEMKLIAGSVDGVTSPIETPVPILYADVTVRIAASSAVDGVVEIPIPAEMTTVILYVYEGTGKVFSGSQGRVVSRKDTVLFATEKLSKGSSAIRVGGVSGSVWSFMLMCGVPLNEPIARHGPFVMNTKEELQQAFDDYRAGTFVKRRATERLI